jgi:hypothetical protein
LEFFDKSQIIPDNIYYQEDDPEVIDGTATVG